MAAKRLLNEKEVSEYTGFKVQTLQKWRMLGRGPRYLKIHCSARYDQADVDAWIESCRATGQAGLRSVAGGVR